MASWLILKFLPLADAACSHKFFFLPPWWEYLKTQQDYLGSCAPIVTFPGGILPIVMAVLDMLLRAAGFVAVISIVFSGVQMVTSAGNPETAKAARQRMINSLIGLVIALLATAVVTFLGRTIAS